MPLTCKKCQAPNEKLGATANDPCPNCGAIYAKVDQSLAFIASRAAGEARNRQVESDKKAAGDAALLAQTQKARDPEIAPRASTIVASPPTAGLMACAACGKQISRAATSCPNCGHPKQPHVTPVPPVSRNAYLAIAIVVAIVACTIVGTLLSPEVEHHSDMPESERGFLAIVEYGQDQWDRARNSAEKDNLVALRERGLCQSPMDVTNWKGTIQRVGSYMLKDKALSMEISVAPQITLRTEGDLDDRGSKILRGTALYDRAANLRVGQAVIFSGSFFRGRKTCRDEASITNSGSMTAPDFIFKVSEIK